MLPTVAKLLPFALAGAFVPTWTSHVILLLGTERPVDDASAYVAGNAAWRVVLGLTAVFIAFVAAPRSQRSGFSVPTDVAWVAAALLTITGVWLLVRQPKTAITSPEKVSRWIDTLKRFPPWAAFGWGTYNCASPGVQWVYFLGGCAVIALSGLAWQWQIVLLAMFIAVLEVMLVVPIVIFARRRSEAEALFDRFERWLANHATGVLGGLLLLIGVLFVYVALTGGWIGGSS